MMHDTQVFIYYGPQVWFESLVDDSEGDGFLESAFAHDERRREFRVVDDRDDSATQERSEVERPQRLIAKSGDYASLSEHVISNFPGLVQSLKPLELYLHNPPEQIRTQMERRFRSTIEIRTFEYPVVSRKELQSFANGFSDHLIGQESVKDLMLAALYPLTRSRHVKPVVVMLYGPSGVGKTETAQFISQLLNGKLMRKQFSMFQNEKFASYVFGGTHSEESFAHDLLDRESGVILLDEFDKAASVFHSAFYQFFDGGIFEDKNYRVDVGRSLIICTSNYNSETEIQDALGDALFSRFDALIQFQALSGEGIIAIAERLVERQLERLDQDERDVLDEAFIKDRARFIADGSSNIRKLGKSIEELISILLVEKMLAKNAVDD